MRILIADDERINRATLKRRLEGWGHDVTESENGVAAWQRYREKHFDIVITDWLMPEMDGLGLIQKIRQSTDHDYSYIVLLTSKTETEDLVEGLDAGADDFLTKPLNRSELRARLKAGERIISLQTQLAVKNARMERDLKAAAHYVESLLPQPVTEPVRINWKYVPATDLAGDTLGYHWIDDDHLAFYVIDVMGHGLDSALLSVSVLNTLRTMSLRDVSFEDPGQVLSGLNDRFQMEDHGNKCFTIWYGVFTLSTREITWCGGGHPPAIGIQSGQATHFESTGPMLGMLADCPFESSRSTLAAGTRLILYTDGAHEIDLGNDVQWKFAAFQELLIECAATSCDLPETVFQHVLNLGGDESLEDDFTVLELQL